MLELHQFELSHYCEKVRFLLDYKGLAYRKVEVTPGVGQIDLMRMSGQRQVPVLKDGSRYIGDSTAIADYLDKQYPDRPLIPTEPKLRGLTLLIEQWADESIGLNARKCLIGTIAQDQTFRRALVPSNVPDFLKNIVGAVPSDLINVVGPTVGLKDALEAMKRDLTALCFILSEQPYLVTDYPTLADFTVAAMTMYVKFPTGSYLDLPAGIQGKGTPGIADVAIFEPFFRWRDRLYADYRKISSTAAYTSPFSSSPTSINID